MSNMAKALELVTKFNGAKNIPAAELAEHKLVLIEKSGGVRVVPVSAIESNAARMGVIFRSYKGYIFSMDHQMLVEMARGERAINDSLIAHAVGRARNLRNAGIPPIYDTALFGRSSGAEMIDGDKLIGTTNKFPVVDYIIQFGAGVLESRRVARMVQAKRVMGKEARKATIAMWSCNADDVLKFSTASFDETGSILLPLIREVMHHTSTRFRFRSDEHEELALRHTEKVFTYLERQLRPLALKAHRSYEQWDGDVSVVAEPRWYMRFNPVEHNRIASAYQESLTVVPTGSARGVYDRMAASFPHIVTSLWGRGMARINMEVAIEYAIETADFALLPSHLFSAQSPDQRVRNAAIAHLKKQCDAWIAQRDLVVIGSLSQLIRNAGLPVAVRSEAEFKDLIADVRLAIVKTLSDDEFVERFSTKNGGLLATPFAQRGDSEPVKRLHSYLLERCASVR